jgi:nitroreductase
VVTSEIAAWGGPGQRNQPYVDGALFALYLLLAFHSKRIAACPLNLAITNAVERKIKKAGGIPAGERLIMMIAFGSTIREPLRAAMSPRRDVDEILSLHVEAAAQ